jgi:Domain of unknown function (DUF6438)
MRRIFQSNRSVLFASLVATLVLTVGAKYGAQASEAVQQVPQDTLITLERTVCYGLCPSYKLTISADGVVVFEGRRFVKTTGTVQSTISQEKLLELINRFEKINYFQLKHRYEHPADGCAELVTDHPSANTSIRINGKSMSVRHYYGCTGMEVLDDLTKLEQAIDDAVDTAQWIR